MTTIREALEEQAAKGDPDVARIVKQALDFQHDGPKLQWDCATVYDLAGGPRGLWLAGTREGLSLDSPLPN